MHKAIKATTLFASLLMATALVIASVVARAPKEQAELFQERLKGFGLRVTIEPD